MENTQTEQFGIHLMVDGYGAPQELLKDKEKLLAMLVNIPVEMKMHIISDPTIVEVGPNNRKDPGGLSGFVLIAESHIAFHTFPARGFVTIDVYTCHNELDTDRLCALFKNAFQLEEIEMYVQKRGLKYPTQNIY